MSSGAYIALSGLRLRAEQLDRVAADVANAATAGYKGERSSSVVAERPAFDALLQSAVDVTPGPTRRDFRPGAMASTGRNLNLAIEGGGFFVIDTQAGPRYTRNGHFNRSTDGTLVTSDGDAVAGESGPIKLGKGEFSVDGDGTVKTGGAVVGRVKVVNFADPQALTREDGARFRAPEGVTPTDATGSMVRGATLEQANVSVVERMAHMIDVMRGFEALQKGITVMMSDVDSRAISELGRR